MASIIERNCLNGNQTFRVALKKKGLPVFSLTFDSWKAACEWVEKNEIEYYKNPSKYFEWRIEIFYKMKRSRIKTHNHVVRPKGVPNNPFSSSV